MPSNATAPELHRRIFALGQQVPRLSNREIARQLGVHDTTVMRLRDRKPAAEAVAEPKAAPVPAESAERTDDISKDSWTITLPKTRVHTLPELLAFCEVDEEVWTVDRFVCNSWQLGYKDKNGEAQTEPLYQVKAWLKKKVVQETILKEIADLKARAASYSPVFPNIIRMKSSYGSNTWVEHAVYDHHFGALIWAKETGHDDYDSEIARRCWEKALAANMERTDHYKPEGAVFVIGNDMLNADNRAGDTERGTRQSMDSRYQKVYGIARDSAVWAIDQMVARYGRVHVPVVGGNHDPLSSWHMGDYLSAWYRNSRNVTIDNGPAPRKWWEKGVNMLMFTHGNTGKAINYGKTMAAEQPEMWGRTLWRETHCGHMHQRQLIEDPGCTVRLLPSLRPPCAWSADNMYGSIRAAESYVWSGSEGLIGTATFSLLPGQSLAV